MGRRDDQGAVRIRDELRHGQRFIAGAGRAVNDQVVQIVPLHVLQELPDDAHLHRPAPDDRLIRPREQEPDGHDPQRSQLHGHQRIVATLYPDALQVKHSGDAGAMDVRVQQPHGSAREGQSGGKVDGDRALADAPLAGQHENLVLDSAQPALELLPFQEILWGLVGLTDPRGAFSAVTRAA